MSKGARNSAVAEAATIYAGIYLRISDDREGRELGVERQHEDCLGLAARLGVSVYDIYKDNDIGASTRSRKSRPDYNRLLRDARAGSIQMIICYTSGRLTRRPAEHEGQIALAEQFGTTYRYVRSPDFDLNTAAGRMIARVLAAKDANESEEMGERVARARQQSAAKGKLHGGRRGYGHGVIIGQDPETDADVWNYHKVNETEAKEIRALVDAVLAKASLRGLVADLNERAVPTVTGARWTARTLRDLLTSPRIAGIIMHKGKEAAYNEDLAIITREQHDAVIEVLGPARNHTRATPAEAHGVAYRWLGTGLFRCPCGLTMDVHKRPGNRASVYRCRSNRNAGATAGHSRHHVASLDAYVTEWVLRYLARPGVVDALVKPQATVDLAALRAERAGLTAKLDGLAYAFATDQITLPQLTTATETVKARLGAIDKQLAAAVQTSPLAPLLGVEDVRAAWEALPLEVRRLILDELVTVTVAPNPTRSRRFDRGRITVTAKG
jgi:site-specific DNA recombinase